MVEPALAETVQEKKDLRVSQILKRRNLARVVKEVEENGTYDKVVSRLLQSFI